VEEVIESNSVGAAVRTMMANRSSWTGTASDLSNMLSEIVGERIAKSKSWPVNPRSLSGRLRRVMSNLREIGIEIEFRKEGHARTRLICITSPNQAALERAGVRSSVASAASAGVPRCNPANGIEEPDAQTVAGNADDLEDPLAVFVRPHGLKSSAWNDADDADANSPPLSAPEEHRPIRWRGRL